MKRFFQMKGLSGFSAAALAAFILAAAVIPAKAEEFRGVCYEVFVYSFYDSDGDGTGDLNGLTQKLDYINDGDPETKDDLGCAGIWTMPVFPSPTYHKYDVTDYMDIDPVYGTMSDFEHYLDECHKRGIKVILDLPINHTSSEHPWFLQAKDYLLSLPEGQEPSDTECRYADYYNFSREQKNGYAPLGDSGWYYEAQFWEGMPDLNLSDKNVRDEIREIVSFWLGKGVDGFRLDAVTSYYTGDKNANMLFLSWLVQTVKKINPDAYLVGEAWTDQKSYAALYQSGIDSLFDFTFSGADGMITGTVRGSKKALTYAKALESEEELYASVRPSAVNAPFYTNHDMARSAGYYAWDDGSRTKLAGALNLLGTGNAFLYYGEELGMTGSGRDENKRAPMYWSADPGAEGMCIGPPEMEDLTMLFPSLEEQAEDPLSIFQYFRKAIQIRNSLPALAEGRTHVIGELSGREVCVFTRSSKDDSLADVTVAVNTSAEKQTVDLSAASVSGLRLYESLETSAEKVVLMEDTLILPPFSAAFLMENV